MSDDNYPHKREIFTALEPAPACNQNERNDGFAGHIPTQRLREWPKEDHSTCALLLTSSFIR